MVASFLEPHLKNSGANATQNEVGIVFLIVGAAYTVTTIPTGMVSDNLQIFFFVKISQNQTD